MNTVSDFYDNLDLKYPEIAIAMEIIDRSNPGKIKFIIPILTPNLDTTKLIDQTVYQDKSNLKNDASLEIDNVSISNYIEMTIPKELCAFVSGEIDILEGSYINVSATGADINGTTDINGSGTVKADLISSGMGLRLRDTDNSITNDYDVVSSSEASSDGSINVNGNISINGSIRYTRASVIGRLNTMPVDRYIPVGSKWIVVFIGGDITKPKIIARYTEDEQA